MNKPIIGISGNARSGKNSLAETLEEIFKESNTSTESFALANNLKSDLNSFTEKFYGISAYTKDDKQKSLLRDLMVAHGKIMRNLTGGKYWCDLLEKPILDSVNEGNVCFITDIRFCEFKGTDEVFWVKEKLGGILVHVTRILSNGEPVSPANNEEAKNEKGLIENSDFHLTWQTTDNKELRKDFVRLQLKDLIDKVKIKYGCNKT